MSRILPPAAGWSRVQLADLEMAGATAKAEAFVSALIGDLPYGKSSLLIQHNQDQGETGVS
jgi:hypothetical protein